MLKGVIYKAAGEAGIELDSAISAIKYARANGGIKNSYNVNTDLYSSNEDKSGVGAKWKKFSKIAQKEFAKVGFLTDRDIDSSASVKMVGLRLTRLPLSIVKALEEEVKTKSREELIEEGEKVVGEKQKIYARYKSYEIRQRSHSSTSRGGL